MTAYALAHLRTQRVNDDVIEYLEKVQTTLDPFAGRFLVQGASAEIVEGSWPGTVVVVEFPTAEQARDWYKSAAHQEILPLWTNHNEFDVILAEGVPAGHDPSHQAARLRTKYAGK